MALNEIVLQPRTKTGKNGCRQLRAEGMLPGIVYGKGIEPTSVALNPKDLTSALAGERGQNTLLSIKGCGALEGSVVIVADLLKDPLKRTAIHVDFHKLSMDDKIRVHVPVKLVGTAAGVKEGGMLDFPTHSLDIECLPGQIPENIEVDINQLTIGHSIHVADLKLAAGVKVLLDGRASIVSVLGKAKEEAPAAE
ncbi:50S ribosomal protein L25 [Geobacter sp. OR-1]|uniref:50S ribosomal protein L25 n=1 Tax=Geobacter sp. OR-1 TaxID=1266765 RepID=UPI00054297AC|nr:50S ribosomal protein L25 [Geobacter sp. OR-1]GAM10108.1 50S ribosomal protein L25 [Geobacter sp. OR-1]